MRWQKATEAAARVAAQWTTEGGPGGAIILFDGADIRAQACGGLASIELGLPFTASTAVRFASISKHFLCATVLRLQDEGVLSLDDPLGKHLPDLAPAPGAVPMARALDMTAGLPDTVETLGLLGNPFTASIPREAMLRVATAIDALNFEPGSEISYSNTGYRLLEEILRRSGRDYATQLRDRFFRPLGLTISLPEDETVPVPALTAGYWHDGEGWRRGRYGVHVSASGGLVGSALDLVAWLQALLIGAPPAADLLAPLGARRRLNDGTITDYGLGLARSPLPGEIAIGHGGSLPGYKSHFLLLPARKAGVVVVCNREDADAHGIALQVLAAGTGAALPESAAGVLPQGLFVAEDGPFWIEQQGGVLTWLGATESLVRRVEDDTAVSRSPHQPVRLRYAEDAIEGEIGLVKRRFRPVLPNAALGAGWEGEWVCPQFDARFTIGRSGGETVVAMGAGALRGTWAMTALDANRALIDKQQQPWRVRPCLMLEGDTIRLVSNRSRVLRFERVR